MDNQKIAEIFQESADLLDIRGENPFRIRSYRKAAQLVGHMSKNLREIYKKDRKDLESLPGIGKHLAGMISELIETGECREFNELKKSFPQGVLDMLKLRGIGPKKVKLFYNKLKIFSLDYLKKAALDGRIRDLKGMGEKTERMIVVSIDEYQNTSHDRMLVSTAYEEAMRIVAYMKECAAVKRVEYVGSLRRMKETIGDLDILTTGTDSQTIMNHFVAYPDIKRVTANGDTKSSVILDTGVQVDLRVLKPESFGAAQHYFTGSKAHNIHIRGLAKRKGLKISEYGVFRGDKMIGGATEEEVFASVGLPWIPPELREDNGEFDGPLPKLIEDKDIQCDLHMHSTFSDGSNTIEEMARAYKENGYEHIAMTDHSGAVGITGGMKDEAAVLTYCKRIDALNSKFSDFKVLKGCEVDILKDGSLYFEDRVLENFELVVGSIHTAFGMEEDAMTKRIIKAIENPHVKILGHPSGRLLNQRPGFKFDVEKVFAACKENGVAIEINSSPMRLDLQDIHCKLAKSMGVLISINTDAHDAKQMRFLKFGVAVARRGWLEKKDVINTWSLNKLLKFLER